MGTKEIKEIVNAYLDGRPIEVFNGDSWVELKEPNWNFTLGKYRVRPSCRHYHACIRRMDGVLVYEEGLGDHPHNPDYWIRVPSLDITINEDNS